MATLTRTFHQSHRLRLTITRKADSIIQVLLPRRCMVISVSLLMVGVGIPMLMCLSLLPLTFVFGFLGFSLIATGGALSLILYGEI